MRSYVTLDKGMLLVEHVVQVWRSYYFIFSMHVSAINMVLSLNNTVGQLPGNEEQGIFSSAYSDSQLFYEFQYI